MGHDELKNLPEDVAASTSVSLTDQGYRLFVRSVVDYAMYMLDPEGRVVTWNKGAERLNGYSEQEIVGQPFTVFFEPRDIAAGKPHALMAIAEREGHVEDEGWRLRKDGTRFWGDAVLTAIRDPQGHLIGFGKMTRDLTDRREAEENAELLETLVSSVVDYAIFMLDPEGHIMTWNKGAERLKGYTRDEVIGHRHAIFYSPEDAAAGKPKALLNRALAEGRAEDEGWRVRKDGSRFWADVVITPLYDKAGILKGFAKVTRDLTERRRNELLKDEFLAILSHELRTPINAIMGFGSILEDQVAGPLTPSQHEYIRKMLSGADVLLTLVNDLLDMSRIQAGRFSIVWSSVDLREVVEEVLANLKPLADFKQITLSTRFVDGPPKVPGDDLRVHQVITNLVSNAIKFTPVGGHVTVSARRDNDMLRCEVTDTGPGIAPKDRPRLFQRFSQLDTSATRENRGTGLGLAITKALVEAHGGRVGVDSTPGQGATFWFLLPLERLTPP